MGAITEDNLKELLDRVQTRIKPYNVVATEDNLKELITTIADRICLRVGDSVLSDLLYSIAVDATVKMVRRINYEGINSESVDTISTSFVSDVLSEYDDEFRSYIYMNSKDDSKGKRMIRFLWCI